MTINKVLFRKNYWHCPLHTPLIHVLILSNVSWLMFCFCLVSRITLRVTSPSLPQFHQCCVSSSTTSWSTGKTNTSAHLLYYPARACALWFQMPINQWGTLRFAVQILQRLKSCICLSSHKKKKFSKTGAKGCNSLCSTNKASVSA